jgi:predicted cupin superfamily sugar epimerase
MNPARDIIEKLRLEPHPEGGWYRETWRGPVGADGRETATAIHFLLEAHQRSHWHKVDAAEIWAWHAGDPMVLARAPDARSAASEIVLGGDLLAGQQPQAMVEPDHWQAAWPMPAPLLPFSHGFTLVSCVVAPAFRFEGFVLAAPGWQPGG